jgi:primosomal protein N'
MKQLRCACGFQAQKKDWEEAEIECELCTYHPGIRCPKCGEEYDEQFGTDWPEEVET